jgi:hypothetical protein
MYFPAKATVTHTGFFIGRKKKGLRGGHFNFKKRANSGFGGKVGVNSFQLERVLLSFVRQNLRRFPLESLDLRNQGLIFLLVEIALAHLRHDVTI